MLVLSSKTMFLRPQDADLTKVVESYAKVVLASEDFAEVSFSVPEGHTLLRATSMMEVMLHTFGSIEGFITELNSGLVLIVDESDYRAAIALVATLLANTYGLGAGAALRLVYRLYLSDILAHNQNYLQAEPLAFLATFTAMLGGQKLDLGLDIEIDFAIAINDYVAGSIDLDKVVQASELPRQLLSWILNATIHPLEPARWVDAELFAEMFIEHGLEDKLEDIVSLNYDLQWAGMRELSQTMLQALDGLDALYANESASLERCWQLYLNEISFSQWLADQPGFFKKFLLMNENKYNIFLMDRKLLAA